MAIILGEIDTLKRLIDELRAPGLDFRSLNDIISFKANWKKRIEIAKEGCKKKLKEEITESEQYLKDLEIEYQNKIKEQEELLKKENEELASRIGYYSNSQVNFFKKLYFDYKKTPLLQRKRILESDFENEVKRSLEPYTSRILSLAEKVKYSKDNIDLVAANRIGSETKYIERAAEYLEKDKNLLAGAIGEQRVVEELKKLPNTYHVINGFRRIIKPALHKRDESGQMDYISSIQIDHIVVGSSGVFVIETKNWSKESMENPKLFSPVKQLYRLSYALFIYLQFLIRRGQLLTLNSPWGEQKIPLRNILLMMDKKTVTEYPHVKILTLKEIIGYITYFPRIYSEEQVREISQNLFSREDVWYRR